MQVNRQVHATRYTLFPHFSYQRSKSFASFYLHKWAGGGSRLERVTFLHSQPSYTVLCTLTTRHLIYCYQFNPLIQCIENIWSTFLAVNICRKPLLQNINFRVHLHFNSQETIINCGWSCFLNYNFTLDDTSLLGFAYTHTSLQIVQLQLRELNERFLM